MSFINYSAREINCKLVYYGPGLCGKTTNLQFIYTKTKEDAKGKMISLATETERTLFFDFLDFCFRGFQSFFFFFLLSSEILRSLLKLLMNEIMNGRCF